MTTPPLDANPPGRLTLKASLLPRTYARIQQAEPNHPHGQQAAWGLQPVT
jgi:hypothetical protein